MVGQLRCRVFAKLFVAWELLTCCGKRAQAMAPKHGGAAPRGSFEGQLQLPHLPVGGRSLHRWWGRRTLT
jgi:hypothetical protein